ncbi:MAG: hypothetical protein IT158_12525 [Bryobacterales bacterium]|nr:hypothetical protein [Bryobacterales bacterium]
MASPGILHLHTYFLFPFVIDKQAVVKEHAGIFHRHEHWIDGLDGWILSHQPAWEPLGGWRRAAYSRFDMDAPAYQDMVFFHPFVRRVFFDSTEESGETGEKESLLRTYTLPVAEGSRLLFEAEDARGRCLSTEATDLRLFLFANGIGILSIGVEALGIGAGEALWINESMRKVYPSSGRQLREGRIPNCMRFVLERDGSRETLVEERFTRCAMKGFLPPLAKTITSLIYFADYGREEYEPVLDERMIVYTYFAIDPATVPPDYRRSEEYRVLLSRFLYVDRAGSSYRYDPEFTRGEMQEQMYRRWAHQGTWYGYTSYSSISAAIGTFDCDEHQLREGFLIHRMFNTRYYLMAIVALFYRATLLHFNERTAYVSKRLYLDQEDGRLTPENIRLANGLRSEFLHFSNYWYFEELANKDEEVEHFTRQCRQYRIEPMKNGIEAELEKLDASLHNYNQMRNTEAVNRLAMLSLILGAGAVLTGFFGMNFGRGFARLFFEPDAQWLPVHYSAVVIVAALAFAALFFGTYMVAANWADYRDILHPKREDARKHPRAPGVSGTAGR